MNEFQIQINTKMANVERLSGIVKATCINKAAAVAVIEQFTVVKDSVAHGKTVYLYVLGSFIVNKDTAKYY